IMGLRRKRWWASLVLPFALLLAAGCGGGAARVEGNVTLDGEPVDGGTISFFAAAADKQHADKGHGPITNGHYAVNSPDLKPGNYRVEIFWNKKTGKTVNNPS